MRNSDSNSAKFSAGAIAGEPQCIAAITGTARRRIRSVQEKARILAESFEPGARVSEVARRNGVSRCQLSAWRRQAVANAATGGDAPAPAFTPVTITAPEDLSAPGPSEIEIELNGVRILVRGTVDGLALRTVLSAVRSVQ